MSVDWTRHRWNLDFDVVDFAQAESGEVWAVAQRRHRDGTNSAIFRRGHEEWVIADGFDSRLRPSAHRDGSIVAVGESSVHFDKDGWVIRELTVPCSRVWGAHASCVYALCGQNLFHFDGHKWVDVDLEAMGIPGDWSDGDCDSAGTSWVVGCWETHSCMAKGRGTQWKQDGCGSWYLYRVHIGDDGIGFAAGGDGLWRRSRSGWAQVRSYGHELRRMPIAVGAHAGGAVVVAWPFLYQRGAPSWRCLPATGGVRCLCRSGLRNHESPSRSLMARVFSWAKDRRCGSPIRWDRSRCEGMRRR